jgi:uncharacterized protein YkwD
MSRRLIVVAATVLVASCLGTATAGAATAPWAPLFRAINTVRRSHGLRPVAASPRLHWAARHHSSDMVFHHYFAHTSPYGSTLYRRIVDSGFRTYGYWEAGETLAWGTGFDATPSGVVRMWMHSPEHRAILLSPLFHFVGIGRARGTFKGHSHAAVWTADWGHR